MLSSKRFIWKWRKLFLVISLALLFLVVVCILGTKGKLKHEITVSRYFKSKRTSILQKHNELGKIDFAENFKSTAFSKTHAQVNSDVALNKEVLPQCFHMSNCFDFGKCENGFLIYVYPLYDGDTISPIYSQVLNIIKSSIYFTEDAEKACLFVLSVDTLDRDDLSTYFVKDLKGKIKRLKLWNNGENHLVLNLFSGTFPKYLQDVKFNVGKAIIAKASSSLEHMRKGFDVSLPLLPKYEENKAAVKGIIDAPSLFPIHRKYLLSFKGKRYVFGIGSESRNALHLINNNKDILLLTTCKHGKSWIKYQDERCQEDNDKYDSYDYDDLLKNSTFCLVPRGRRLGSFRFLEVMRYGCIPVLLSNGWNLPFEELLDWSKFSLNVDERNILQLPSLIRGISQEVILAMRQQALFVYKTYFSSTYTIVMTMLEELKGRIYPDNKRSYVLWNKPPGAVNIDSSFSQSLARFPFYGTYLNTKPIEKFTAVIVAISPVYRSSAPLFNLIQTINLSEYVDQIFVVWLSTSRIPERRRWPKTKVTLRVVHPPKLSMNARFIRLHLIKTDAVFTFDEDVSVNPVEINFAFSVWLSNPDQLVGFTTSSHYTDTIGGSDQLKLTSKLMNEYSIIQTSAAVYHRYFNYHYNNHIPKSVRTIVEQEKTCESLAMNFAISKLTNKPPIKVARSPHFKKGNVMKDRLGVKFSQQSYYHVLQKCFKYFTEIFAEVPLVKSKVAMNPVFFKDPVSIARKKFKKLE